MLVFLNSESIEHFFPRCDEFRLRGYPWFLAGIGPPAFRGENKPPSSLPLSVACDVTLSRFLRTVTIFMQYEKIKEMFSHDICYLGFTASHD